MSEVKPTTSVKSLVNKSLARKGSYEGYETSAQERGHTTVHGFAGKHDAYATIAQGTYDTLADARAQIHTMILDSEQVAQTYTRNHPDSDALEKYIIGYGDACQSLLDTIVEAKQEIARKPTGNLSTPAVVDYTTFANYVTRAMTSLTSDEVHAVEQLVTQIAVERDAQDLAHKQSQARQALMDRLASMDVDTLARLLAQTPATV